MRLTDLQPAALWAEGVRGVLLDVDNTLTTHGSQELSPAVKNWLDEARETGLSLIIVSNARKERVQPFAARIGLPFVWCAAKPLPFGIRRAARQIGQPRQACILVGDQLFTDDWGGKLAGIRTVLLSPIEPELDQPSLLFKRRLEHALFGLHKEDWQRFQKKSKK